jgi:hypothetical protein
MQVAHPDREGTMVFGIWDNHTATQVNTHTMAYWTDPGTFQRGRVDRNFLRTDLSVSRIDGLVFEDDRLVALPGNNLNITYAHRHFLPAR